MIDMIDISTSLHLFTVQPGESVRCGADGVVTICASDGTERVATSVEVLAVKKRILKDQVNSERQRRETLGVPYVFPDSIKGTVQTRDADDYRNINGQCSAALILQAQGVTSQVLWFYDAENVQHFMTPAQMLDLGMAVQGAIANIVKTSRDYKNRIDDPAIDLSTIDPINGW